ncbi:MAG: polyketide synthase, partial [Brevibacterium sp.]
MTETSKIAIVGMSCLLPGAHTPEEFWTNLERGVDSRRPGSAADFGIDPAAPGGWGDNTHRITDTRAGFVDEPEIDLEGLAVPPGRLVEGGRVVTWSIYAIRRALASAGLLPEDPRLARTGLVFGNYSFPTLESTERCLPLIRRDVAAGLRNAGLSIPDNDDTHRRGPDALWPASAPATLVADAFNIGGPRLAVDAACASALYSLALGCEQLRTGSADTVVVGSICAPDSVLIHLSFSDLKAYPGGELSLPFHSESEGIVTGQGAGAFVLRRLDEALADGDDVLATVDTAALGNDGSGTHLLAPSMAGQLDVYRRAYGDSDPGGLPDYIECHATGTPLGDEVELSGLAEYFGDAVPLLGSVKGNVGHLLTVAGFTSMLKVVLALRHGVIPATPGLEEAELRGPESATRRIVRTATEWPDSDRSRRAGVSSFGFGGVNAHVVLSSPPDEFVGTTVDKPVTSLGTLAVRGVGAIAASAHGVDDLAAAVRGGTSLIRELPPHRWYGLHDAEGVEPALRAGY